jgi:hypothetical protein
VDNQLCILAAFLLRKEPWYPFDRVLGRHGGREEKISAPNRNEPLSSRPQPATSLRAPILYSQFNIIDFTPAGIHISVWEESA